MNKLLIFAMVLLFIFNSANAEVGKITLRIRNDVSHPERIEDVYINMESTDWSADLCKEITLKPNEELKCGLFLEDTPSQEGTLHIKGKKSGRGASYLFKLNRLSDNLFEWEAYPKINTPLDAGPFKVSFLTPIPSGWAKRCEKSDTNSKNKIECTFTQPIQITEQMAN